MYWYKTCPFCKQGRLFVYKNLNSGSLYLHCEECERGYHNPENLNSENSFLTLTEDFGAVEASKEDFSNQGWDKFQFNESID